MRHVVYAVLAVLFSARAVAAKGPPKKAPEPPAAPPAAEGRSTPTSAVTPEKTEHRPAAGLGCDRLTIAEGLPNSDVTAVVQDKLGFIWFGTQDGLARYDGTRMRVYRPVEHDATSLSSGYIQSLELDATGKLWIGTPENGVNVYDPEKDTFTRYVRDPGKGGLSSEGVTAIARDRKDRIWLAMSGGGLDRFEPEAKTFVEYTTKPLDAAITALDVDAAGNLWLGMASDGVIRWNPDGGTPTPYRPTPGDQSGMPTAPVKAILVASTGMVWIGTEGEGLVSLDPKTGKVVRYRSSKEDPATISDDHVSVLFEDKDKNLWIGTTNGLNRLDPQGHMLRYLHDPNDPQSLSFTGVESIIQDQGGVMWIGGFTNGVCKFDDFGLNFGYHAKNFATSFFEDQDGTLWVGTYNDGLWKYDPGRQHLTIYHELRHPAGGGDATVSLGAGSWISAVHRDKHGTLWLSLRNRGLIGFDTKTETYKEYVPDEDKANTLPVDSILAITEDDQGLLWLASWGAGLVRFDPRLESFTDYTADATDDTVGLSSNHLYALYPDPTDNKILWIGTGKGGLVRFNTTNGTATSFRHKNDDPDSLSSDDVTSIYAERGGSVWVGTYGGGLNRIDPTTKKVEHFTTANSGLTNNTILGLLPDNAGRLWMSTNGGGLVQFDPKSKKFLAYDAADGIQDNEFNQGSFKRTKGGELFFGGPNGFNAFFPDKITRDAYVPPVVATAFKVFNQEVKLDKPIWTSPKLDVSYSDSFEVQFAALAFGAPKKNRYAYKLEGFDDKFIETDRPYATYTKLGGGHYTLRIRASNRHGVWNETGVALDFAVAPPLWRTWPAYIVYLLVLAAAAYALYRIQRGRVRRAEREGRLAVVERDLALTGAVQTGFLPEQNEIVTAQLQVLGLYRPADACGGDWWWHEPLSRGRHVIMVGDVTGHGPGPAMVTAAVATAFRVLMENGLDDVEQGLALLNREVLRVAKGKYHMTMAAFEIEESTGRWTLYSAGAPPILSLNQNGKHRVHFCPGAPLGTETGFETGRVEGKLAPGDRMLLYTDGIPEIALPNGNVLGMRRFAQLYERTRSQDLREAAATIVLHADQSQAGQPQLDDWTFTMIEWRDEHTQLTM